MGDLNCDLFITHNNKLIDTMDLYILRNIIVKPKRVADHSNTLLDPLEVSDYLTSLIRMFYMFLIVKVITTLSLRL